MTWLVVILGLALLVLLHELGHFTAARLVGMKPRG
jgi:membrane-associated protease RseP (regulator of RpoE activity)